MISNKKVTKNRWQGKVSKNQKKESKWNVSSSSQKTLEKIFDRYTKSYYSE